MKLSSGGNGEAPATEVRLRVEEMMCGGCVSKVERWLTGTEGVRRVVVDLEAKTAVLEVGPTAPPATALAALLTDKGFPSTVILPTPAVALRVGGMKCEGCASKVRRLLEGALGVTAATVDLAASAAFVQVGAGGPTAGELAALLSAEGFPATPLEDLAPIPPSQDASLLTMSALKGPGWGSFSDGTITLDVGAAPIRVPAEVPTAAGRKLRLDVEGLKCGSCVAKAEALLRQEAGVLSASVNLATKSAAVTVAPGGPSATSLAALLTAAGLQATAAAETAASSRLTPLQRFQWEEEDVRWRLGVALLLVVSAIIGHIGHIGHDVAMLVSDGEMSAFHTTLLAMDRLPILSTTWWQALVATAAILFPGSQLLIDGFRALLSGSPTMNSMVLLGVLASFLFSVAAVALPALNWAPEFAEPVMLIGFVLFGRALEARARLQSSAELQALLELQVREARRVTADGKETIVAADSLVAGDRVRLLPGDRVPVDGVVADGVSLVNEAMLTGEATPVRKDPGSTVTSGTTNLTGVLVVTTTASGQQSVVAQIVTMVEDAQARKAPMQRTVDRIAGWFCWATLGIATATGLLWGLYGGALLDGAGDPWATAIRLATDVIVVACPCALGLATPTAILVGTGAAAQQGVLVRGADILQKAAQATAVLFDKTGTLTTGDPEVSSVQVVVPPGAAPSVSVLATPALAVRAAAAVEAASPHPLARAIVRHAVSLCGDALPPARNAESEAGFGMAADVVLDGAPRRVYVGSEEFLRQRGVACGPAVQQGLRGLLDRAATPVLVAVEGDPAVGILELTDTLRPEAVGAIAQLRARGVRPYIVTGDRLEVAQVAAARLGIPAANVFGAVTPAGKADLVRRLQEAGDAVVMVGDGINDAPALAQADVGIALRRGTDVAFEAADVVLMRDSLTDVPRTLTYSDLTVRKVQSNLVWALLYNVVAIPIAAGALLPHFGVLLSPSVAGGMMALSSVSVVANSVLLRSQIQAAAAAAIRRDASA